MALWTTHTWVFKAFGATGRLAFQSMIMGAGKSTALTVVSVFSHRPVMVSNATSSAVFGAIDQWSPTLFFDETDAIFHPSGQGRKNEDLRGILNDGYTKGGGVLRMRGNVPYVHPVFAPAAFGGIGRLPGTLEDRAFQVHMMKPPKNIELTDWDEEYEEEAKVLKEALVKYIKERAAEFNLRPDMPKQLRLRNKQIAKPLISIADACGWGERGRHAVLESLCDITTADKLTPSEELITLLASYGPDGKLSTGEVLDLIGAIQEDSGKLLWATWIDEQMLGARQLASLLKPHGIMTCQFTRNNENRRGYNMADFRMWSQVLQEETA